MKLTRHNGRAGKNGVYNPKHNDRNFNVANSEHINMQNVCKNIYWDCVNGLHISTGNVIGDYTSFDEVELIAYRKWYTEFVMAQHERNEKTRHTERDRTVEDLLHDKRTCPEETIYQIGTLEESVSGEVLTEIAIEFFNLMSEKYGSHVHILDWALHMDEGTPHIHERHVFDCENQYGEICPQQEKALEKLGIPLPDPDKKQGKNNNRKQSFDVICRDMLFEVCEKHGLKLDMEPTYGGRRYLEKQEFIIAKQKRELEEVSLKLSDVEELMESVTEEIYENVCESVTESARQMTQAEDIESINKRITWLSSSERKSSEQLRQYAVSQLQKIVEKISESALRVSTVISQKIRDPAIRSQNIERAKTAARVSVREKIMSKRALLEETEKISNKSRIRHKNGQEL